MRLDALSAIRLTGVPNFEFFVVADRSKLIQVVMVPADVLDDLRMGFPCVQRINSWRELIRLVDVPKADSVVITSGKKQALLAWVPVETVAFSRVAQKSQIGLDLVSLGTATMLKVVKNVNFTGNSLRSDDFVRLRHVSRSVNLALMIDLEFNLNALILCNVLCAKR